MSTTHGDRDTMVLAVDGGNSKTDLALVRADGSVMALVRGPLGSPHHIGLDGCVRLLGGLLDAARRSAGLETRPRQPEGPAARAAHVMLAGLDFPAEERRLHDAIAGLGWAMNVTVHNDTFAVLRAGTERGWGVAVTCGSGINCVGIGPDGRHVRFASLGAITGDWGGGYDLGVAALGAAARSQDGRGPTTSLEHVVPAHFGRSTPLELAEAIHVGTVADRRLSELAPVVFEEADHDQVASELIERLGAEVVDYVRSAVERLELEGRVPDVLLGGGLMQATDHRLVDVTRRRLSQLGLDVDIHAVASPPIVGAALLGLDEIGADDEARARVRRELREAVAKHVRTLPPPADEGLAPSPGRAGVESGHG